MRSSLTIQSNSLPDGRVSAYAEYQSTAKK